MKRRESSICTSHQRQQHAVQLCIIPFTDVDVVGA